MQYGFDGCPKTFGIFDASLMRSRFDAANDVVINLFADKQAAGRQGGQARQRKPSIAARAYVFVS